jgi:large subunit ribosomal protein L25
MAKYKLAASVRNQKGKEAARKLRAAKKLPAVFYGPNAAPVPLTIETSELKGILKQTSRDSAIIGLEMTSGEGGTKQATVMIKELQRDNLRGEYLHADFYEISMDKEITADIAVNFVGDSIGVTNGGILQYIRREITISCLPDKITDRIDIDVSGLDIGDALHVEDIEFPEGIRPELEGHLTIAVLAAPKVEKEVAEEEEEELEGVEEGEGEKEAAEETPAE